MRNHNDEMGGFLAIVLIVLLFAYGIGAGLVYLVKGLKK
tara:strand:- start:431 stop:547 length:117 start_codon:yes stop_codon:yes gene_type:complete